jgi:DNA-binding FadR family transcriptional regulator
MGRMAISQRARQAAVLLQVPELPLARRTVKELIVDKLVALIATGVLQSGDDLPSERDLAAALSVSRETVRGAVQTLAGRGIVEITQGARTRVVRDDVGAVASGIFAPATVNRYDIDSVHAARLLVEQALVADAAVRIDEATLARLDASLLAQKETMGDPIRFLICDREFHLAIYRSAQNALLCDFVTGLYTYMLNYRRTAVSRPGAIARSYEDHVEIVAGLRAHDAAAVVAAFRRHIERIYATTRTVLGAMDEPA